MAETFRVKILKWNCPDLMNHLVLPGLLCLAPLIPRCNICAHAWTCCFMQAWARQEFKLILHVARGEDDGQLARGWQAYRREDAAGIHIPWAEQGTLHNPGWANRQCLGWTLVCRQCDAHSSGVWSSHQKVANSRGNEQQAKRFTSSTFRWNLNYDVSTGDRILQWLQRCGNQKL